MKYTIVIGEADVYLGENVVREKEYRSAMVKVKTVRDAAKKTVGGYDQEGERMVGWALE